MKRRPGRPLGSGVDPFLRIMARTVRVGTCLEFTGYLNGNGYGWVSLDKYRHALAHRVVWQHHHPSEPLPQVVMHTCDNRPCVEITHLRAGTHALNTADMVAKGRQAHQRGEQSGRCKLTTAQVAEMRARRAQGAKTVELGLAFGVHPAHVSRIVRGLRRAFDANPSEARRRGLIVAAGAKA